MGESAKFFRNLIDSSEMICSLKYEDMRGCPYEAFGRHEIIAFSTICVVLAALALIAGM